MNITWKYLFSNTILKRGENYYRNGNVLSVESTGNSNTKIFYVQGTGLYTVKITRGKKSIKKIQCDCPYARGGAFCKHMAAALFKMEENGDLEVDSSKKTADAKAKTLQKPTKVFPFKHKRSTANEETPYQYYKFDKITENSTFYSDDFETAKKLIESKRIILKEVYEGFPGYAYGTQNERECAVHGTYIDARKNEHIVRIRFSRNELLSTYCSVPNCPEGQRRISYYHYMYSSTGGRMCAHLIALLLLAQDYVIKKHLGDATDLDAFRLIRQCREENSVNRERYLTGQIAAQPIHLEPRLDVDEEGQLTLESAEGICLNSIIRF